MAKILSTSDELWIVVEQLTCPPRKKTTFPVASNKGVVYNKFQKGSPSFFWFKSSSIDSSRE